MSVKCPHTYASYSKWRLHVFKRLISDAGDNPSSQLPFLYPAQRYLRRFHASRTSSRNFKKDIRRTAKHKVEQTKTDNTAWNPLGEGSLEDLKSLVGDLSKLSAEAKAKQNADDDEILFEKGTIIYHKQKPNDPQSPLERRLPWDRPPKLKVEEADVDTTLRDNIWARTLASSVRLDRGTKVRQPRALMNSWGLMSNPKDKKDYFLPIELSDLDVLKQQLRSPTIDFDAGEDSQPAKPTDGQRVQISTNRSLIQAMSGQFTLHKPMRGVTGTVTSIDSRKISMSLVPHRWRLKYKETEAFTKIQRRFNEALKREPDENDLKPEGLAKLDHLQWKLDIADRMEKIMWERVLLALDAVGKDNESRRATTDKRVSAIPLPKDGQLQLDASGGLVEGSASIDEVSTPDWLHGVIFLFVGDPASYHQTVEHWNQQALARHRDGSSQLEPLPTNNLIPPTIAISDRYRLPLFNLESLLGHANARKVTAITQQHQVFDIKSWQSGIFGSNNKDVESGPDVNPVAESTVSAGEQILDAIVRPGSVVAPSAPLSTTKTASSPDAGSDSSSYLVMIKPRAQHADILTREIWQLWRFLGGRSGLALSRENDTDHRTV